MTSHRLVRPWRSTLSGCGLIDSDVTNFDLTLLDKQFSVDAAGWQVDQNGRRPTVRR